MNWVSCQKVFLPLEGLTDWIHPGTEAIMQRFAGLEFLK